jgi:methyl-accepting chemotaxis protein
MTAPISRAVVVAERIATGDLSSPVEVRIFDETGCLLQAIAAMQDKLNSLVGGIRSAADSIQVASSEVAASNLQQTASSREHLSGIVMNSADSARLARQLASSAASAACAACAPGQWRAMRIPHLGDRR